MESSEKVIRARVAQLEITRAKVLKYLAESSPMTTETFFAIFDEFLADFESSRMILEKKEQAAQRERKNLARRAEERNKLADIIKDKSKLDRGNSYYSTCVAMDQRGVVDNVMASLRSGPGPRLQIGKVESS